MAKHPSNLSKHFLLLIVILWLENLPTQAWDSSDWSRLRNFILSGYDVNALPVQNKNNLVTLRVRFYLNGFEFNEMDNSQAVLTVHTWTVLEWNDIHLKWDPKQFGNLSAIHVGKDELWRPDISVHNNFGSSEIDHFGNVVIFAKSNGFASWVPPTKFQVGCETDLRLWPYDTQTCFIFVGSWSHTGAELNLTLAKNHSSFYYFNKRALKNREWNLVSNSISRYETHLCCPETSYNTIVIQLTIRRRSASHSAVTVFVAIANGTLVSFLLRPTSRERLFILLTLIMVNSLYLNFIYKKIPKNGDSVPLILYFYRDSLVMVTLALVWTVFSQFLATSKRNSPVPLPVWTTNILESWAAKFLCLNSRPVIATKEETDDEGELVKSSNNSYQDDWFWLANLLDRIVCIVYLITYICFALAFL